MIAVPDTQAEILAELREIKSLLQRMPELVAVATMLERYQYWQCELTGKPYPSTVTLPDPTER